jgi:SAM-dependent methyltransferase
VERLYSDLAGWWPLISPPSHYVEEAADLLPDLLGATDPTPRTLLELGCGGGSLAWHLKKHFALTLTDLSPQMLANSRALNPDCEHAPGDMRTIDLGREFDVVFIHDAIMYMTDEAALRAALANARRHCRRGGAAVIVPDCVRETFEPDTDHGGEDGVDGRGVRYLEWTWDPDPDDTTFETVYALVLREADGSVHVELDRHTEGMFPRASWLTWMEEEGFAATSRMDKWDRDVFVGRRRT